MTQHTPYRCVNCTKTHCPFCDGGLVACTVCNAGEGSLPTECHGTRIPGKDQDAIQAGALDFSNGRWTKFGVLARSYLNKRLELQVLESAGGWYIGTADDEGPCSRESNEYFPSRAAADDALVNGGWTQKEQP